MARLSKGYKSSSDASSSVRKTIWEDDIWDVPSRTPSPPSAPLQRQDTLSAAETEKIDVLSKGNLKSPQTPPSQSLRSISGDSDTIFVTPSPIKRSPAKTLTNDIPNITATFQVPTKVPSGVNSWKRVSPLIISQLLGGLSSEEHFQFESSIASLFSKKPELLELNTSSTKHRQLLVDALNESLTYGVLGDLHCLRKIRKATNSGNKDVVGYAIFRMALETKRRVLAREISVEGSEVGETDLAGANDDSGSEGEGGDSDLRIKNADKFIGIKATTKRVYTPKRSSGVLAIGDLPQNTSLGSSQSPLETAVVSGKREGRGHESKPRSKGQSIARTSDHRLHGDNRSHHGGSGANIEAEWSAQSSSLTAGEAFLYAAGVNEPWDSAPSRAREPPFLVSGRNRTPPIATRLYRFSPPRDEPDLHPDSVDKPETSSGVNRNYKNFALFAFKFFLQSIQAIALIVALWNFYCFLKWYLG
ncbi:hypothetical protein ABW19_dt0206818 [Dactylella cylindrospora]|nr:hypothetical protein ABW19_dt0206818 [Dactylella cylindrospora]